MKTTLLILVVLFYLGMTNIAAQNTWTRKADLTGGIRGYTTGFAIGGKGYILGGDDNIVNYIDCWEYDPLLNAWTQKANFGGGDGQATSAVGFSIGNKGYLLSANVSDFWEFDPVANTWTQKASFPGHIRIWAVAFSIGSKGYIGTGTDINNFNAPLKDFWEYDPAANSWTQKADFPGTARTNASGFSIGSKGYLGVGDDVNGQSKDFYEYNPSTNGWTQKADFMGQARAYATGFSIGNKGYIGTGENLIFMKDFYEYDPLTNTWTQETDFGGTGRYYSTGFSIGGKGYLGTGYTSSGFVKDFWEYTPSGTLPLHLINFTVRHSGKANELSWVTSQELNSSHFEINRSIDGRIFSMIGEVEAKGSSLQNNYTFTDLQPVKTFNYYRLKITDNNGSFTYSEIKRINNAPALGVSISPNPVNTGFINLSINTEKTAAISVSITNMKGQVLYEQQLAAASAYFTKSINITAFAKGMYLLKAVSGNENNVIKFLKE